MFLGIITYLDTIKSLKTASSEVTENCWETQSQMGVFLIFPIPLSGFFCVYVSLGIITYLDTITGLKTASSEKFCEGIYSIFCGALLPVWGC